MTFKVSSEGPEQYPAPERVAAAIEGFNMTGGLDQEAFGVLAHMPLSAKWTSVEWDRGLVTSVGGVIELPELPGDVLYMNPGIRRFCAAVAESSIGFWERTILAGLSAPQRELLHGSPLAPFHSPQSDIRAPEGDPHQVLAGEKTLQMICFDNMNDTTTLAAARGVVEAADQKLQPGGLLIVGGRLGYTCLEGAIDTALGMFDLEYEQQGADELQAVFRK